MSDQAFGRAAQRQALVEQFAAAVSLVVGPRVSVEPVGSKAVSVQLDAGSGGTLVAYVAPWWPALTRRRDLANVASNVANAIHDAVGAWPGATPLGPQPPIVSRDDGHLSVQFFGASGEPLPIISLPAA